MSTNAAGAAGQAPAEKPWGERADLARMAPGLILAAAAWFHLMFLARGSVAFEGRTWFTLFDDAMISMRYARTLAAGGGFTWNPGESPIEGITNPLWTLWMALMHLAPVPEGWVPFLVGLSSSACLLATAIAARHLARMLGAGPNLALAAMAMVAFYYPLAFWSLRGMETGVLACLMLWSMVLALRQLEAFSQRRLAWLAGMAVGLVWVRQDAVVFVAVLTGFMWLAAPARERTWATLLGATLAALALLTILRLAYYGELLPNTYHLKVTGVASAERIVRGLESLLSEEMRGHLLIAALVLLLSLPGLLGQPRDRLLRLSLPLAAFGAQVAYSVHVGGDVWEMLGYPNRYIVIAMPGLIVLSVVLMQRLAEALATTAVVAQPATRLLLARLLLVGLAALLWAQTSARHALAALQGNAGYVEYDRGATQVGLCLRAHTRPDARIAYIWAGTMPYYAERHAIDLLGKMDKHVARAEPRIAFVPGHNKWDYAHSVDTHAPDIILQLWKETPDDMAMLAARGYVAMPRDWPCFANGFLVHDHVLVKPR